MPKRIETADELMIISDVEEGKYTSLDDNELVPMLAQLKAASSNTIENLTKKKAINIRLLESDIVRLKSMALNEGMPYQTYISHMK